MPLYAVFHNQRVESLMFGLSSLEDLNLIGFIQSESFDAAFSDTQNDKYNWSFKSQVIYILEDVPRSTSVGDVICELNSAHQIINSMLIHTIGNKPLREYNKLQEEINTWCAEHPWLNSKLERAARE